METSQDIDSRAFALKEFLKRLAEGPLRVERDSWIASALQVDVTQRIMSSAVNKALHNGWVWRSRNKDVRDFYDNPVTFTITPQGREWLASNE